MRVADIRARMARAAQAVGRDPRDITLVAATKQQSAEAVKAIIAAGVTTVGENRVQEMVDKLAQGAYEGAALHFIGHLQTNKVRQVVGKVALIQSVDSLRLAQAIQAEAASQGIEQHVLLEFQLRAEANKTGFPISEIFFAREEIQRMHNICVDGIMCIPPVGSEQCTSFDNFTEIAKVYVDITSKMSNNRDTHILSMGMSEDFEDAIRAGTTMVRVGTALFGVRQYN